MTKVTIRKASSLGGIVEAPSSKAYAHRALIAASLSEGESRIMRPLVCDDTEATANAVRAYGAKVEEREAEWVVYGTSKPGMIKDVIDCGDSAATMRFVTPITAHRSGVTTLTGGESLRKRPMEPLLVALRQLGVVCYSLDGSGRPPLVVHGGGIRGGTASIPGDISSQFVSGLLFASPLANGDVRIQLTSKLESRSYVEMTLEVLRDHRVIVESTRDMWEFFIPHNQSLVPSSRIIPGDYSSAAFLFAAAAVTSSKITVTNLERRSLQGDRAIVEILMRMGADLKVHDECVEFEGARSLEGVQIDVRDIPDLAPVCAVLGCYANGRTVIRNAKRLRIKEADRIESLVTELNQMSAMVTAVGDDIVVEGPSRLRGTVVDSHGDHRIAMACAVAALGADGETEILNAGCVSKSYPKFYEDLRSLGGKIIGG